MNSKEGPRCARFQCDASECAQAIHLDNQERAGGLSDTAFSGYVFRIIEKVLPVCERPDDLRNTVEEVLRRRGLTIDWNLGIIFRT